MFAVFPLVRQLQELLWYLDDAARRPATAPVRDELDAAYAETDALTAASADVILALDLDAHRDGIAILLRRASEHVRAGVPMSAATGAIEPGANLMGAQLAGADLRGADLRGAWLIGADLRSADLSDADVIGADFRDTELGGADLASTLFLTQFQVNAAQGDAATVLPDSVSRPSHWRR